MRPQWLMILPPRERGGRVNGWAVGPLKAIERPPFCKCSAGSGFFNGKLTDWLDTILARNSCQPLGFTKRAVEAV